jgi:osmotically-inducible protein OsmY
MPGIAKMKSNALMLCKLALLASAGVSAVHANEVPSSSDQKITQQVKELISEHPEFGTMLTVQTRNGVVYLGGTPWTQFTLVDLEPLVRQADGVANVVVTAVYPEE